MIRCISLSKLYPAVRIISADTYGMYLIHILMLPKEYGMFEPHLPTSPTLSQS